MAAALPVVYANAPPSYRLSDKEGSEPMPAQLRRQPLEPPPARDVSAAGREAQSGSQLQQLSAVLVQQ